MSSFDTFARYNADRYKKGAMIMTDMELKRLYRRIERASRLRTPWYAKLATLLSVLF